MTGSESNASDPDPDTEYARMAELAERLATDIALAEPDWCSLAADAAELAKGTKARCEGRQQRR